MAMRFHGLVVTLILLRLCANCLGFVLFCNGTLTGGDYGDIIVEENGSCLLSSVSADIVFVDAVATLTVDGISDINGISADDGAIIDLKNRTSVGSLRARSKASISVSVEKTSFVESLRLRDAGSAKAEGPFGSIESVNSGVLNVTSSTIRDDIRVEGGTGDVNLCGSTVLNETIIDSRPGNVTLGSFSAGCSGSRFDGAVIVTEGLGSVILQGSSVSTGITLANRTGVMSLSFSSFGDVLVSRIVGDVSITSSSVNKYCDIRNIQGAISLSRTGFSKRVIVTQGTRRRVGLTTIKESAFRNSAGRFRLFVRRRGQVSITSNNFLNGNAVIRRNRGPLLFSGNSDVNVSLALQENGVQIFDSSIGIANLVSCSGGVMIQRNAVQNAEISSCSGLVDISRNSFGRLRCFRNRPAPVGVDNSITRKATGQCAKFQR